MKIPLFLALILMILKLNGQNVGIGTNSPMNPLHIISLVGDPVRIEGLQSGQETDSILTINNEGVVKKRFSVSSSGGWGLTGNSGVNPALNFIGTINNSRLAFRTNNLPSGFIEPDPNKRNNAFGKGSQEMPGITGMGNNSFGYQTLSKLNVGSGNIAIGDSVLYNNQAGSNNVGIGANALEENLGAENIAIGSKALSKNIGGTNNIGIGVGTLSENQYTFNNVAVGGEALPVNKASDNIALGYRAGYSNTTGIQNTAVGTFAMAANISGNNNTYLGYQSAQIQETGNNNTLIGSFSGVSFSGGNDNTFLGSGSNTLSSLLPISNSTALGANAIVDRSDMVKLGNNSITRLEASVSLTTPSDGRIKANIRENIPGLTFIKLLRPVSYNYDLTKWNSIIGVNPSNVKHPAYYEKEKIVYSGFIAQEVYEASKQAGYDFSGVTAPLNEKGIYGLAYAEMVVPLVKAVQELNSLIEKQQKEIEYLKEQILLKK